MQKCLKPMHNVFILHICHEFVTPYMYEFQTFQLCLLIPSSWQCRLQAPVPHVGDIDWIPSSWLWPWINPGRYGAFREGISGWAISPCHSHKWSIYVWFKAIRNALLTHAHTPASACRFLKNFRAIKHTSTAHGHPLGVQLPLGIAQWLLDVTCSHRVSIAILVQFCSFSFVPGLQVACPQAS